MKSVIILTLGLCMALALVAGCSQPAATPTATTVIPTPAETAIATEMPTAVATTAAESLTPGPTQTLSEIWGIEVQVASNGEAINPTITTTLRGGKGMNVVPEIDVKVTRSDGVVEEDRMIQPLYVGKSVSLAGTTKTNDRAEVWAVTPNGEKVKIYDSYVCFRCY